MHNLGSCSLAGKQKDGLNHHSSILLDTLNLENQAGTHKDNKLRLDADLYLIYSAEGTSSNVYIKNTLVPVIAPKSIKGWVS
jgi:hypothetical protein